VVRVLVLLLTLIAAITKANSIAPAKSNNIPGVDLLSSASIFKPIIADPKWPRFSLGYQYHMDKNFGRSAFAPNIGAVLPLIRNNPKNSTVYEFSVHGGLFAVMDISSNPTRLINSDYYIGPALAIKHNQLDLLFRIAHTSGHMGDELLLDPQGSKIKRINLSYEVIDIIAGYNMGKFRPTAGVTYIVHADPKEYKCAEFQVGLDYRPDETLLDGYVKPVFGIYSKTSKNYKWRPTISIKGGLELKDKVVIGKSMQILLEYYNGNSVNGQFYQNRDHYMGLSLSVNF
jgi:hypothetical protein